MTAPRSLTADPADPDAVRALDAALAELRAAILLSDEFALSVAPPRVDGFGAKKLVGMATIWYTTHTKREGDRD